MTALWIRGLWLGIALAFGVIHATLVAGPAEAQQLRTFTFASLGDRPTGVGEYYFGIGLEKGWFEEAGIDFRVTRMMPGVAYPAIAGGEIDGTYYAASAAVAALRGAPLVVVYYGTWSVDWSFIVDPNKIKSVNNLSGARCVASTGTKSATHIAWAAMIDHLGGDPRAFQPVGLGQPPPFWLEAVRAGTAECMWGSDGVWTNHARRVGLEVLGYLPDVMPIQGNGLAVSPAALKDPRKRELITDVIGVFLRAADFIRAKENRAEVTAMVRKWMGSPAAMEAEDYEAGVDSIVKLIAPNGYIEDERILGNMLATALRYEIYEPREFRHDPRTVDLVAAGAVDQSLIKEAAARGGPLYRRR